MMLKRMGRDQLLNGTQMSGTMINRGFLSYHSPPVLVLSYFLSQPTYNYTETVLDISNVTRYAGCTGFPSILPIDALMANVVIWVFVARIVLM